MPPQDPVEPVNAQEIPVEEPKVSECDLWVACEWMGNRWHAEFAETEREARAYLSTLLGPVRLFRLRSPASVEGKKEATHFCNKCGFVGVPWEVKGRGDGWHGVPGHSNVECGYRAVKMSKPAEVDEGVREGIADIIGHETAHEMHREGDLFIAARILSYLESRGETRAAGFREGVERAVKLLGPVNNGESWMIARHLGRGDLSQLTEHERECANETLRIRTLRLRESQIRSLLPPDAGKKEVR